ncbi:DUF4012 domain-containing protein, partial [Candidatus Woesebacteria bacterium]|nr:DUF4012 domain-containing protein [Candidatus Woesebacteria bacterium]
YTTRVLSALTLHRNATIESLDSALQIASRSETIANLLNELQSEIQTEELDLTRLLSEVTELEPHLSRLAKNLPHCAVCTKLITPQQLVQISNLLAQVSTFSTAASHFSTGEHRYLILLQNSDELRATGGFAGSYIIATIAEGKLQPLIIEDIYDADGQFTGTIPAPPGVDTYLSSDKGLRLPDANWDPNFPTSAKQLFQFFSFGDRGEFEGVIAITDNYFEELLTAMDPIWLPDYQLTVTPENLTDVLRSDRSDFFAGSIQKKHLLEQFQNQLVIQLSSIDLRQAAMITLSHMYQKNILLYSRNEQIQTIIEELSADGSLISKNSTAFLAFVESNVGINKANKHISRAMAISREGTSLRVWYLLQNDNEPPQTTELTEVGNLSPSPTLKTASAAANHLGYINYQRILYPKSWEITSLSYNSEPLPLSETTTETIPYPNLKETSQTGFLVTLPEKSVGLLEVVFTLPETTPTPLELELYKQPGTLPFPIWIEPTTPQIFDTNPTMILEKNSDTIIP